MSIIKSILNILDSKNIRMSELCLFLGINTSTMANWKTRETDPPAKYIAPICEFIGISTDYLLTGKEKSSSSELTADEQELLTHYKKLDLLDKGKVIGRAETLASVHSEKLNKTEFIQMSSIPEEDTEPLYIELYNLPVSAGTGVYLDNCDKAMLGVRSTPFTEAANFALEVRGDSMEPKFSDGDYVLIRTQPCVNIGEIGIFILNAEGYIKKFGGDKLISLNTEYNDILITEYDDFCCKGKVLGILPNDCIVE